MDQNSGPNSNPGTGSQEFQRWTAKRKAAIVLDLIKGLTTAAEVARKYGLTVAEVERWVDAGLHAMESGLRSNPKEAAEEWEAEKKDLFAKIGQLSLEVDVLKKCKAWVGGTRRKRVDDRSPKRTPGREQIRTGRLFVPGAGTAKVNSLLPAQIAGAKARTG